MPSNSIDPGRGGSGRHRAALWAPGAKARSTRVVAAKAQGSLGTGLLMFVGLLKGGIINPN